MMRLSIFTENTYLCFQMSYNKHKQDKVLTHEDYLAMEDVAEEKHEYYQGKLKPMAGGSMPHNKIATNISRALDNWVEENNLDFLVLNSDSKIRIEAFDINVYPDAVVVCQKPNYWKRNKTITTDPLLVFEVLSPSTHEYDKSEKFSYYRSLDSFSEYVTINQYKPHIEAFFRQKEQLGNDLWKISSAHSLENTIHLASVGFDLPLKKIYWRVPDLQGDDWLG